MMKIPKFKNSELKSVEFWIRILMLLQLCVVERNALLTTIALVTTLLLLFILAVDVLDRFTGILLAVDMTINSTCILLMFCYYANGMRTKINFQIDNQQKHRLFEELCNEKIFQMFMLHYVDVWKNGLDFSLILFQPWKKGLSDFNWNKISKCLITPCVRKGFNTLKQKRSLELQLSELESKSSESVIPHERDREILHLELENELEAPNLSQSFRLWFTINVRNSQEKYLFHSIDSNKLLI